MLKKSYSKGFTLIELLVVISIISVLSSVVLSSVNSARLKGRDAKRLADLHQIELALDMYYDQYGSYPVNCGAFSVWYSSVATPAAAKPWTEWNTSSPNCLYTSLVAGPTVFMSKLPIDPVNTEAGSGNFLGDGPLVDLGYVYVGNPTGSGYVLGTNLEKLGVPADFWGNYQIKK